MLEESLSARRAWIEMSSVMPSAVHTLSLSARRAWIEMLISSAVIIHILPSLSARRAWIEISGRL